jgi:hypothetical protein
MNWFPARGYCPPPLHPALAGPQSISSSLVVPLSSLSYPPLMADTFFCCQVIGIFASASSTEKNAIKKNFCFFVLCPLSYLSYPGRNFSTAKFLWILCLPVRRRKNVQFLVSFFSRKWWWAGVFNQMCSPVTTIYPWKWTWQNMSTKSHGLNGIISSLSFTKKTFF